MHRTPSKVVIPNLSESLKKYKNLCKLGKKIMLIYKINFSSLTLFSLLNYIFCGRARCRQTEVQTDDLCLLRKRIGEVGEQTDEVSRRRQRIGEQTNRQTFSVSYAIELANKQTNRQTKSQTYAKELANR